MRLLHDKPLIGWTVDSVFAAGLVDHVLISTDDPGIMRYAQDRGVSVLERPQHLAGDRATSVDVALHVLECEQTNGRHWDTLCLLQPTSPFRQDGRIDEGITLLHRSPDAVAVIGVIPANPHPHNCLVRGADGLLSFGFRDRIGDAQADGLPPAFAVSGAFYGIRSASLRERRSFFPPGTAAMLCDSPGEEIDIDTEYDFDVATWFAASAVQRK